MNHPTGWTDSPTHHAWLAEQTDALLRFYQASSLPQGDFAWLGGDGTPVFDEGLQLWINARMIYSFSIGSLLGRPGCDAVVARGLDRLRSGPLHDGVNGGWFWRVDAQGTPVDSTKQAYGHAFVLLAAAAARLAGHDSTDLWDESVELLDSRFWDEDAGLFVDTWDVSFTSLEPYRGQNANMHLVEAYLLAAEVSGEQRFVDRALRVAQRLIRDITAANDWRLPEHFDDQWHMIADYGLHDTANLFRPYGSTIGHWIEWSRLLLQLHHAVGDRAPWLVPAAQRLFDGAVSEGWDAERGGFAFSTDWSGTVADADRYHWVLAEAIGASVALARTTGDDRYDDLYKLYWNYAADHLIESDGSWVHQLDSLNRPSSDVWDGKPDLYHALQATLFARIPFGPSLVVSLAQEKVER